MAVTLAKTPRAPRKQKVTYRKYMGDDVYSYAVFIDGRLAHPTLTGLGRTQAQYYKKQVEERLAATQSPA